MLRLLGLIATAVLVSVAIGAAVPQRNQSSSAQRTTPVSVENDDDRPVPVDSGITRIPVFCDRVFVDSFIIVDPERRRASSPFVSDVNPVPVGFTLLLTDFLFETADRGNEALVDRDPFCAELGRRPGDGFELSRPNIRLHGRFGTTSAHWRFAAPPVVIAGGQKFSVRTCDRVPVLRHGVVISGFLVSDDDVERSGLSN
ncbi:MAG: hypothetical protein AAGH41_09650 [Pseudomonadota bacterium]